jgi:hypothetical protein
MILPLYFCAAIGKSLMILNEKLRQRFHTDNYHPDTVAHFRSLALTDLKQEQFPLRIIIAFSDNDLATARRLCDASQNFTFAGYDAYQIRTAHLLIAAHDKDQATFEGALKNWCDARILWPGNWIDDTLAAEDFKGLLPPGFTLPIVPPRPVPSEKPPRMVRKNIATALHHAIIENLTWLRELGFDQSEAMLAASYSLRFWNGTLREATVESDCGAPDLILAYSPDFTLIGSFISH